VSPHDPDEERLDPTSAARASAGRLGCKDNTGRHDVIVKRSDDGGATFGHAVIVCTPSPSGNGTVAIDSPACVLDGRTERLHICICRNV
jgi:hypothetical protein